VTLLRQENWTRWPTEIPPNTYHSGYRLQAATFCSVSSVSASRCYQQDVWGSKKLSPSHSVLHNGLRCCCQRGMARLTETCVRRSTGDGDLSPVGMPPHCSTEWGCTGLGLVSCAGTVLCHPLRLDHWGRARPGWQERKNPLLDDQMDRWSIFFS